MRRLQSDFPYQCWFQPARPIQTMLQVLRNLECQEFQDKMSLLMTFKCLKAKYILSQHLITSALAMCVNDKTLHFKDEKMVIFPFYCEDTHFYVTVEKNKIVIRLTQPMQFKPHEIQQYHSNFTTSAKNIPEIEMNEDLAFLICPDILHSSQVTISKISLFDTLNNNQVLQADMRIMEFSYGDQDQILSIPTSQDQIYKDDNFYKFHTPEQFFSKYCCSN